MDLSHVPWQDPASSTHTPECDRGQIEVSAVGQMSFHTESLWCLAIPGLPSERTLLLVIWSPKSSTNARHHSSLNVNCIYYASFGRSSDSTTTCFRRFELLKVKSIPLHLSAFPCYLSPSALEVSPTIPPFRIHFISRGFIAAF